MQRTAILNVVGLTPRHIGEGTPRILEFFNRNASAVIEPVFPAVTTTAQATYLTGLTPREHGIVGNGWYDRDLAEHQFWKQSNRLVKGRKLWEALCEEDPDFTCAKLFWWYNMYSTADYSITPRPLYPADGRKVFDVHTHPMGMRERIKKDLGPFPFPHFWGPLSDIRSSKWIADSAKWVEDKHWPGISLVYLPHLDYNLQRLGPDDPAIRDDLAQIDEVVGDLIRFYEKRHVKVVILSEYGITSVDRPVHLNRVFREKGWVTVKNELGRETLELGSCKAIAIADHQVAHIYLNDASIADDVRKVLDSTEGVEEVLFGSRKHAADMEHPRSGDLIAIADERSWFTYYFWEDDRKAPDYARCVDIHRKPGYDPVELFLDPGIRFPKLKVAGKLARKALGFRTLMDVIPLDASLVKGSHGRIPDRNDDWPVLVGDFDDLPGSGAISATDVFGHLYNHCAGGHGYAAADLA